MRQALGPGALGRPGGSGWGRRWQGGSGWGRHVNPRPFHFNIWQNSLQIKKINKKEIHLKKKMKSLDLRMTLQWHLCSMTTLPCASTCRCWTRWVYYLIINECPVQERVNSAGLGCPDPAHSKERPVSRTGPWLRLEIISLRAPGIFCWCELFYARDLGLCCILLTI